jgi:hypothetical protein
VNFIDPSILIIYLDYVLGLPKGIRIDKQFSRSGKGVVLCIGGRRVGKSHSRYFTNGANVNATEFRFQSNKKRDEEKDSNFLEFDSFEEESLEADHDANGAFSVVQDALMEKQREYNVAIASHPTDFQVWLDFIMFQESLPIYAKNKLLLVERQLDLYERALLQLPHHPILTQKYLRVGSSSFWDLATSKTNYKEAMRHVSPPNSIVLDYLSFIAGQADVNATIAAYAECIDIGNASVHTSFDSKEITQLHLVQLFARLLRILAESGQRERACGLAQAQLECTFYRPEYLRNASWERIRDKLGEFWDQGAPRIGDPNAVGWSTFVERHSLNFDPPPGIQDSEVLPRDGSYLQDDYLSWATQEQASSMKDLPLRISDPVLDPEGVVLWEDIFCYLIDVHSDCKSSKLVLYIILEHFGLEIAPLPFVTDPLLVGHFRDGSLSTWFGEGIPNISGISLPLDLEEKNDAEKLTIEANRFLVNIRVDGCLQISSFVYRLLCQIPPSFSISICLQKAAVAIKMGISLSTSSKTLDSLAVALMSRNFSQIVQEINYYAGLPRDHAERKRFLPALVCIGLEILWEKFQEKCNSNIYKLLFTTLADCNGHLDEGTKTFNYVYFFCHLLK